MYVLYLYYLRIIYELTTTLVQLKYNSCRRTYCDQLSYKRHRNWISYLPFLLLGLKSKVQLLGKDKLNLQGFENLIGHKKKESGMIPAFLFFYATNLKPEIFKFEHFIFSLTEPSLCLKYPFRQPIQRAFWKLIPSLCPFP